MSPIPMGNKGFYETRFIDLADKIFIGFIDYWNEEQDYREIFFFFFFSHFEKFIIFFGKRKLFSYHVETWKIVLSKVGLKSPKYIYIYIYIEVTNIKIKILM